MGDMFAGVLITIIGTILGIKLIGYGKKEEWTFMKVFGWIVMAFFWFIGIGCCFLPGLASLTVNHLWFSKLAYVSVFWKVLGARWQLFLGWSAVAAAFVIINALVVKGLCRVPEENLDKNVSRRYYNTSFPTFRQATSIANWITVAVVLIIALSLGGAVMSQWNKILLWTNQVPFGETDPIFSKDVGFYVFSLPVMNFFSWWFRGLVWLTIAVVAGLYGFYYWRSNEIGGNEKNVIHRWITHLLVLWLPLMAISVWRSRLKIWGLVYSKRGAVFGAGYADMHAQIGAYKLFIFIAVLVSLAVLISIFVRSARHLKGKLIMIGSAFGAWVLLFILIVGLYPALYQYFVVRPNELAKETEYIAYNIHGTRQAYGLDRIEESEAITGLADFEQIKASQDVLANVRVWDWRVLRDTLRQIQEIRLYYEFADVDMDRYNLGGKYSQVMLAAREMAAGQIPEKAQTWVNQRLKYTHGYGVCLNRVNEFKAGGMPNLLVKDIPPQSVYPELEITRPEIYYGELTNGYVFINTKEEEFDYPFGEENVYTRYEGTGGVRLGSGFRKLAFMLDFFSLKMVLSGYLTPDSQVMFHRQINERVEKITPFLVYEPDPYIVIGESGKLWWLIDGYTKSRGYPYSEPYDGRIEELHGVNYLRNSVKVAVDAYNGTVDFFVWDTEDPIIKVYQRIFPGLFRNKEEMPDGLAGHVRYPDTMLTVQADVFSIYHMANPQVFYNREDLWNLPNEVYMGGPQPMLPYFVIATLPGGESEEFINMLPLTPARKKNMIAWLCGRTDGENYGKLVAYRLPKGEIIKGPEQIEAGIDQHEDISGQLTLWDQHGSQVIRGNLLVIPFGNSLFYIEPIYLQAENAKMPELKRIVVATGDKINWGSTLSEALEKISVGVSTAEETESGITRTSAEIIRSANSSYEEYLRLTGEGKTAEAGQALQQLKQDLQELQKMQE